VSGSRTGERQVIGQIQYSKGLLGVNTSVKSKAKTSCQCSKVVNPGDRDRLIMIRDNVRSEVIFIIVRILHTGNRNQPALG